jgi:hypothetical protein
MRKIEDFENVKESGSSLPKGIYLIVVVDVVDKQEKEYLEIKVDIADGEFKGFAKDAEEKFGDYPNSFIARRSYKPTALGFFKSFTVAVEKSNPGYTWGWNEATLIGKKAVGVFDEEEYEKDGELRVSVKLREIRSIPSWKDGKVKLPGIKKLQSEKQTPPTMKNDYIIPEITDKDLPF